MIDTRHSARQSLGSARIAAFLFFLFVSLSANAQQAGGFDEIAAQEDLRLIQLQLEEEEISAKYLSDARAVLVKHETSSATCAAAATSARVRLETRFEPLRDIDPESVGADIMEQRRTVRTALDDAIAMQSRCENIQDEALFLLTRLSEKQAQLSQEFLSRRGISIVKLIAGFPERAATWPSRIRESIDLELVGDLTTQQLLWILILAGAVAAAIGLLLRQRFNAWYLAAGGDDAPPQLKFLLPKPVAEYAPLWLEGATLVAVLSLTLQDAALNLLVIRVAWAIFAFGLGCVVINWATGPLSPSVDVKGLIPDHVNPLRTRLRFLLFALCSSFVVLGTEWLAVRVSENYVSGRASMIFLVGVAFVWLLRYLRYISGLQERYRLIRNIALTATVVGIIAVLTGYQNLAGYLIHGIARSGMAVFFLWFLLWLTYISFDYLIKQDTPSADRARATLGISGSRSKSGIGFMRLLVDLLLWISFIVYMLYVWDDSGTTLGQLYELFFVGTVVGSMRIVPIDFVSGILIFAAIIIVIGWIKRWIDRRWLQHIVMERGARDAIVTLFGYVGFIIAVVMALVLSGVDLTGLALIGGALALGIGFGMQEIANNFISGLILLFERPIRAGDFVSVGDVQGFVRSIRIRATEIETLDNQNVLVPNSELVSGRVTNWVLRDTHGRLQVVVGVAYGSDVDKVKDILETVAHEHPEVITDGRAPAPRALFMGFGDSSLNFELRVRVLRIERRFSVMSDLNFAIDKAFRESGVTIPFPQRDLHIISQPKADSKTSTTDKTTVDQASQPEQITRRHEYRIESACAVDEVWASITDIDIINRWLSTEGEFNARIGGEFRLLLRDGFTVSGRIDVFMPPRRLRVALAPQEDEGPIPSGPVTIDLSVRSVGECTELRVEVAGIPASEDYEEYYRLSEDRWTNALTQLKSDVLGK